MHRKSQTRLSRFHSPQPEPTESPTFFVYDLPANLSAYQTAIYGVGQDFSRRDGYTWLVNFYRSRHRTVRLKQSREIAGAHCLNIHYPREFVT